MATVPGIGPINATALVAAVGDATAFGRARDLAAWLGAGAEAGDDGRQGEAAWDHQSGAAAICEKNLIHGARAALPRLVATETPGGCGCAACLRARAQEHRGRRAGEQAVVAILLGVGLSACARSSTILLAQDIFQVTTTAAPSVAHKATGGVQAGGD